MKVINRKATFNYEITETFEAGLKLIGAEVKSIRDGRVDLGGSFVKIMGSEAYLINALIPAPIYARPEGYEERRSRKLLFHKSQLLAFKTKQNEGYVLVPMSLYTKNGMFKLEVGVGRGKKKYEKREAIKKRDLERETGLTFK
jgi:SsrA-binding protein